MAFQIQFRPRYPYPAAWRKRLEGRTFYSPGEAIRAAGRRQYPYRLLPIQLSEAKEKPVQRRANVGVQSHMPDQ